MESMGLGMRTMHGIEWGTIRIRMRQWGWMTLRNRDFDWRD